MVLFLPEFPGGEYKVLGQILLLVPNKIIKLHSWGNFIEMQACKCHGGTEGRIRLATACWLHPQLKKQTLQLATATVGQAIQLK
jgi:hypothetical protein